MVLYVQFTAYFIQICYSSLVTMNAHVRAIVFMGQVIKRFMILKFMVYCLLYKYIISLLAVVMAVLCVIKLLYGTWCVCMGA